LTPCSLSGAQTVHSGCAVLLTSTAKSSVRFRASGEAQSKEACSGEGRGCRVQIHCCLAVEPCPQLRRSGTVPGTACPACLCLSSFRRATTGCFPSLVVSPSCSRWCTSSAFCCSGVTLVCQCPAAGRGRSAHQTATLTASTFDHNNPVG
jgi:hypothetical protein